MAAQQRIFRVFVSSTFTDWELERNVLLQRVWPKLEDLAASKNCRFQAVDLRWGISPEAAQSAQTMRSCFSEIDRCRRMSPRPCFMILVGNRYGYRPIPEEIPDDEFQEILRHLDASDRTAVPGWYRRDDNALYLQDGTTKAGVWRLRSWVGRLASIKEWAEAEHTLWRTLQHGALLAEFAPDRLLKYFASATEQEFARASTVAKDHTPHILAFIRHLRTHPLTEEGRRYGDWIDVGANQIPDADAGDRLRAFHARVEFEEGRTVRAVHRYELEWEEHASETYLESFCRDVRTGLLEQIEPQLADLKQLRDSGSEAIQQEHYLLERANGFLGRDVERNRIRAYLGEPQDRALLVAGAGGSGKSALLARCILDAREHFPAAKLVYKFCGATCESGSEFGLLRLLCESIGSAYSETLTIPTGYKELCSAFREALAPPSHSALHLIMFLDGLDQLDGTYPWLPERLPPGVHLIVSCLSKEVPTALGGGPRIDLPALPAQQAAELLRRSLSLRGRRLQMEQESALGSCLAECGLPLYVHLLTEFAARLTSDDPVPALARDLPDLIDQTFSLLADPERHSPTLLGATLSYMTASRLGLGETEVLGLLAGDDNVWNELLARSFHKPPERRLPAAVWSRLYLDLAPYLADAELDGIQVIRFHHRLFAEAVRRRFLPKEEHRREVHLRMATYFLKHRSTEVRRHQDLPWHLFHAQAWDQLAGVLAEEEFLQSLWMSWDARHYWVVHYWKSIVAHSSYRATEAYRQHLQDPNPACFTKRFVARLLYHLGHAQEALEFVDRMIRMCQEIGNVTDYREYLRVKADILRDTGQHDVALNVLRQQEAHVRENYNAAALRAKLGDDYEEVVEGFGVPSPNWESEELAPVFGEHAIVLQRAGDLEGAPRLAEQARKIYASCGDSKGVRVSLTHQLEIHTTRRDLQAMAQTVEQLVQICREAGERDHLIDALNGLAEVRHAFGDHRRVIAVLEELAAPLRPSGNTPQLRITLGRLAETHLVHGYWTAVMSILTELAPLLTEAQDDAGMQACRRMVLTMAGNRPESQDA